MWQLLAGSATLLQEGRAPYLVKICFLAAAGALAANVALTGLLLKTSMTNYPGGSAISTFHKLIPPTVSPPPHVHICNLAAQSGVTLFQHLNAPPYPDALFLWPQSTPPVRSWTYNRTENLTIGDLTSATQFTHLISEVPPLDPDITRDWNLMATIPAFNRVVFDKELVLHRPLEVPRKFFDVIRVEQRDQLWIYERR
ncbi:hypothetical protein NP233_g8807 [Leucocoprinus birnbaumii]|uniref:Mannosyltransferase n=1 Tax=Leucocoprinus birnbaumii TaxID=56174 RepID=A0AAD5VLM6_9AGAR|nr:hypothetical protein NP233_g8807 [Leucocoprinus birnbaumii]